METAAEVSTEERIKKAAKLIFTRKGFLATTIRDIAAEAGINVASVNYYFRSKENLFQIVMAETIGYIFVEIEPVVYDSSTTLMEKITLIANHFIDQGLKRPDLPMFIINEVMAGSNSLPVMKNLPSLMNSHFAMQLTALNTDGKIQYNPLHIILNLVSMLLLPFLSLRQLKNSGHINEAEFIELINERRMLVPVWISQIIGLETSNPARNKE